MKIVFINGSTPYLLSPHNLRSMHGVRKLRTLTFIYMIISAVSVLLCRMWIQKEVLVAIGDRWVWSLWPACSCLSTSFVRGEGYSVWWNVVVSLSLFVPLSPLPPFFPSLPSLSSSLSPSPSLVPPPSLPASLPPLTAPPSCDDIRGIQVIYPFYSLWSNKFGITIAVSCIS